jgi:hypothetical protein
MTIIESLKKQVAAEIGEDELNKDETNMIRQKFGIIPPQFNAQERPQFTPQVTQKHHIVTKKERKRGR